MMTHYDVIVIGLGAMGSASVYHLAKRGANVLGIDQYHPPHNLGSTHGETRIIRQANGEGAAYIPLVQRAYQLWRDLEVESDTNLLTISGGLILCPKDGGAQFHGRQDFVTRTASLAQDNHITHELLTPDAVRERLPMLRVRDIEHAYYEAGGGLLRPERCVEVQLALAQKNGAEIHVGERVVRYTYDVGGVQVITESAAYHADKLIISAGGWIADFVPETFAQPFAVYRQVFYWFEADDLAQFKARRFPFIIWIGDTAEDFLTVFPTIDGATPGVKFCTEEYLGAVTPHSIDRTVHPHEIGGIYERLIAPRVAGVRPKCLKTLVCMYTVTPDEGFVIDKHPESERVIIASPCSGHGFKHSPAIGEALSQLALDGASLLDMSPFAFARLQERNS